MRIGQKVEENQVCEVSWKSGSILQRESVKCPIIIKFDSEWKVSIGFDNRETLVILAKASLVVRGKDKSQYVHRE